MNVTYLLKYLWKRKWLVIIPTFLAILLAWWFSGKQPKEYTSAAELSTGYMDLNPLDYNNRTQQNNTALFNNVIQTLQSNQVLDQVSYSLLLHDLQGATPFFDEKTPEKLDIISRYPGGKHALVENLANKQDSFYVLNLAKKEDRMIRELADRYSYSPDALLKQVKIDRLEGSDFIMITATTSNPGLSAFIANEICRKFLALYQNRLGQASATSLDSLRNLLETKKQILDNKLNLLQEGNDPTLTGSVGMLGTLQGQLTQQKSNLIAAQVALQNVNQQISAAGKQGGLANNEEVIALRTNIDNLYAKYVDGGSTDADLLRQIGQLRSELQQKLTSLGGGAGNVPLGDLTKQKSDLEVRINVARETMADLQTKINTLQGAVQSSAARQGVMQGIQNDVEIAKQQYEQANALYNQALNRNMFPGNNFKQVLQASPPLYPNPSNKAKVIGFAGTGVFFFVVFLLLFFEFVDPSIKTPSYLKANVPFPLLANFERINLQKDNLDDIFSADGSATRREKAFREQVKQLRYEVENSGKKVFMMVGYHPGSGRTTMLYALARGLSLSNHKILLIDANFRDNQLSRKYSAGSSVETFESNGDQVAVNKAIRAIAVSTNDKNIDVIGCATGDYTPREVLPKKNIFAGLKNDNNYDFVLIDSAPLSQGPDIKELLDYVDAIILVFAADQALTEEDKKLISFIKENKVQTLGAVLNKIPSYSMDI